MQNLFNLLQTFINLIWRTDMATNHWPDAD